MNRTVRATRLRTGARGRRNRRARLSLVPVSNASHLREMARMFLARQSTRMAPWSRVLREVRSWGHVRHFYLLQALAFDPEERFDLFHGEGKAMIRLRAQR